MEKHAVFAHLGGKAVDGSRRLAGENRGAVRWSSGSTPAIDELNEIVERTRRAGSKSVGQCVGVGSVRRGSKLQRGDRVARSRARLGSADTRSDGSLELDLISGAPGQLERERNLAAGADGREIGDRNWKIERERLRSAGHAAAGESAGDKSGGERNGTEEEMRGRAPYAGVSCRVHCAISLSDLRCALAATIRAPVVLNAFPETSEIRAHFLRHPRHLCLRNDRRHAGDDSPGAVGPLPPDSITERRDRFCSGTGV